jgi:UTP--glucose-1-phosphate uridylyltransferase
MGPRVRRESFQDDVLKGLVEKNDSLLQTASENDKEFYAKNFQGFQSLFMRFLGERGETLDWDKITPLPSNFILELPTDDSIIPKPEAQEILNKLVVLKLNGGLGTSMGCVGPKSAITVRSGLTFLDVTVEQISNMNSVFDVSIPLVLMNSFNTDEDTKNILRKYTSSNVDIHSFNQSKYPRINQETLMPFAQTVDSDKDKEGWYPPGHGDLYTSLYHSGLIQEFLDQGKEYLFVSNIDNLGATINISMLKSLMADQYDFAMELTDKTPSDVKGGTLMQYQDNIRLLEIAQVPPEHVDDFKSVKKFKLFNTNNLWMKLESVKRVAEEKKILLDIIVNKKTLDDGNKVIQLETAVGSGIKCFDKTVGIHVNRDRFLPVKTTADLLLVMSNLYSLKNGMLSMSEKRMFHTTPLIKLGHEFQKMGEFNKRILQVPDIIDLDHLTVSGNVTFGRRVVLKGTVIIIANHGEKIDIPTGAELENKIVSGNLRILDH